LKAQRNQNHTAKEQSVVDACFIYPEVSANVQGFVRSRVSSPGMYLFSDTGAATVDQSTFIFYRQSDNTELLTYLYGHVLSLGSSHTEFEAAKIKGKMDPQFLEMLREKKENNSNLPELIRARDIVAEKLLQGTRKTLAKTKIKLCVLSQLKSIQVIFGGGGHCEHPYEKSVLRAFSSDLFSEAINPNVIGLPVPDDLDRNTFQQKWMNRLGVAYGLSFFKNDLVRFIYPSEVDHPEVEQVWPKVKPIPDAVTKDQC
jgi:hypothetical protein